MLRERAPRSYLQARQKTSPKLRFMVESTILLCSKKEQVFSYTDSQTANIGFHLAKIKLPVGNLSDAISGRLSLFILLKGISIQKILQFWKLTKTGLFETNHEIFPTITHPLAILDHRSMIFRAQKILCNVFQ